MEGGNKLRLIVLFMSFHAMFTVLLLVGMAHMLTRMTHQEHENANLREILFKHVHMASKHKAEDSEIETERRGFQNEMLVKSKEMNKTEENAENDEEEVDGQPMILRIKRTTSLKCCEKGSRGNKGRNGEKGDTGGNGRRARMPGRRGTKGDKGSAGQRGPRGYKGPRGSRGGKGIKGDMGIPGRGGNTGAKGRKGDMGVAGADGQAGKKGDMGVAGADGQAGTSGQKGLQGNKGTKGDRGPAGHKTMYSELIHVVGVGKRRTISPTAKTITWWKLANKNGKIHYSNGGIIIGVNGFYYIYSQMFYYAKTAIMGHVMKIGDREVLKSVYSVSKDHPYKTQYIGGVFNITKGQSISVSVPFTKTFYFDAESSYFGAFMVHNLE